MSFLGEVHSKIKQSDDYFQVEFIEGSEKLFVGTLHLGMKKFPDGVSHNPLLLLVLALDVSVPLTAVALSCEGQLYWVFSVEGHDDRCFFMEGLNVIENVGAELDVNDQISGHDCACLLQAD